MLDNDKQTKEWNRSSRNDIFEKRRGCTRSEKIRSKNIGTELELGSILNTIKIYRTRWIEHVERDRRIPKEAMDYKPGGARTIGKPRQRWKIN